MKLQQLRYACEVARRDFNVSLAAERLYTAQSGISTQIRQLEEELGIQIFVRHGKRLVGTTPEGEQIIRMAERILTEADNIRRYSAEIQDETRGTLSVGATHTQAHHVLPRIVKQFTRQYPEVKLRIHQGDPLQLMQMVQRRDVDIAITTTPGLIPDEVLAIPYQDWHLAVITPPQHPLLQQILTLQALAAWPLITYDQLLPARAALNKAFDTEGLRTNIALTAMDSDTIKTYVALGLGVGVVSETAINAEQDDDIAVLNARHLFEARSNCICLHRFRHFPAYVFTLASLVAPALSRENIEGLLQTDASSS